MFTRVYKHNSHKCVIKSYTHTLSQTEKLMISRGDSFIPDLLMCIAHPRHETHFMASTSPFPNGVPRQISISGFGTFPKSDGTLEWIQSSMISKPINQAIYDGFDFSLLPNPTEDEIAMSRI